jgi:hypothetical protein
MRLPAAYHRTGQTQLVPESARRDADRHSLIPPSSPRHNDQQPGGRQVRVHGDALSALDGRWMVAYERTSASSATESGNASLDLTL